MIKQDKEMNAFGQSYINGWRCVFNKYKFIKGKNKDKIQCFYRYRAGFKKIILKESDIKFLSDCKISPQD